MDTVDVLGVKIACLERQQIMDRVEEWAAGSQPRTILYVNAHCLNLACVDPEYHQLLNQADLVYPDGISVVWAGRLLASRHLHKITGADWIYNFCQMAAARGLRVYILAGKPGVATAACENLARKFPGLQIVGSSDGYFLAKPEGEVLQDLRRLRPHVVFVGRGVPLQEKWLAAHRAEIGAQVCWGVGALFDYVAGIEPRVPAWLNALALEWLWRLLIDPGGKWRRYILGNPRFIIHILRQKIKR